MMFQMYPHPKGDKLEWLLWLLHLNLHTLKKHSDRQILIVTIDDAPNVLATQRHCDIPTLMAHVADALNLLALKKHSD
jgi:hypothetical protein